MLTELMCYLQAPSAAKKGVELLLAAPTQQEQMNIAKSLQYLNAGWTLDLHRQLFEWLAKAQGFRGGNNFPIFDQELRNNSLTNTTAEERKALGDLLEAKPARRIPMARWLKIGRLSKSGKWMTSFRSWQQNSKTATSNTAGRCSPRPTAMAAIISRETAATSDRI